MYGKYLTSMIITNLPQKPSFAFLLEARAELARLHGISIAQQKGHFEVALQIVSPLTNKLYTADTTFIQVLRRLSFSSRICVFLTTSQLKKWLDLLGHHFGPDISFEFTTPFLHRNLTQLLKSSVGETLSSTLSMSVLKG